MSKLRCLNLQIVYRIGLILEAGEFLKSITYNGLEILIDEVINPEVLAFIQDKFNKGEECSKLERIIADVGCYLMGRYKYDGMVNSESDFNENFMEKLSCSGYHDQH